jgi:acetyl esterase
LCCATLVSCGNNDAATPSEADRTNEPMPAPNAQMKAVLDELASLGAKPVETVTVAQARTQPTPADAVKSLLVKQGKSTAPEAVGSVEDRTITGPVGPIPIRIYKPAGAGPFPVAHDDVYATYQWTIANAASLGGIAKQIAVVGESAGGNMAAAVAIRARDNNIQRPVHQGLIYPVTNYAFDSPWQIQNKNASPLSTAGLMWFYEITIRFGLRGELMLNA